MFIPTTTVQPVLEQPMSTNKYCGNSGNVSATSTRHYRSLGHHYSPCVKVNETKRNKRSLYDENIWVKIEQDFSPEILEEHKMNIPDVIQYSPKQTSSNPTTGDTVNQNPDSIPPTKKISALFIKPDIDVECLYRKSGIRENCEVCSSEVVLTDDGFLTCKNPACSILYKDESLDQTAEWRYYGADDNQNNDPTRCGMPVNPLLKESSFGC